MQLISLLFSAVWASTAINRFSDKECQEMDYQMANLRTAIELFQDFRRTYNLPNDHRVVQEMYRAFSPTLKASLNSPPY